MRKVKCLLMLTVFIWMLVSPHILAERTLFAVSEDFFRALEQQQAFEKYMADNNFTLENSFPYLQYNLLPYLPDLAFLSSAGPVLADVNLKVINSEAEAPVVAAGKGTIVGQYSLFSADVMDIMLYQKEESEAVFGIRPISDKYAIRKDGNYTIEARSKFWDSLTVFYGYDTAKDIPARFSTQNAGVELNLFGMSVNADYKKTFKATGLASAQSILNFAYHPGSFASFSAGYGVISTPASGLAAFPATAIRRDEVNSGIDDDVIIRQLKMALYPTTYSQLSADYVLMNEKGEEVSSSKASFGVRFGNKSKELSATYELANEVDAKTTTSAGLELGLVDQASLKAVYSKVEEHQISSEILKSILDLGLNVNFAENSSLYFQYKWVLPDYEPEKEQKAEAKLEIRF